MDRNPSYQQEHDAAVNEVAVTKAAWSTQYHKRKAERDPQIDKEVRDRWIAAKENLKNILMRGPIEMRSFTTKDIKQQEIEAVLDFNHSSDEPIAVDDDGNALLTPVAGQNPSANLTALTSPAGQNPGADLSAVAPSLDAHGPSTHPTSPAPSPDAHAPGALPTAAPSTHPTSAAPSPDAHAPGALPTAAPSTHSTSRAPSPDAHAPGVLPTAAPSTHPTSRAPSPDAHAPGANPTAVAASLDAHAPGAFLTSPAGQNPGADPTAVAPSPDAQAPNALLTSAAGIQSQSESIITYPANSFSSHTAAHDLQLPVVNGQRVAGMWIDNYFFPTTLNASSFTPLFQPQHAHPNDNLLPPINAMPGSFTSMAQGEFWGMEGVPDPLQEGNFMMTDDGMSSNKPPSTESAIGLAGPPASDGLIGMSTVAAHSELPATQVPKKKGSKGTKNVTAKTDEPAAGEGKVVSAPKKVPISSALTTDFRSWVQVDATEPFLSMIFKEWITGNRLIPILLVKMKSQLQILSANRERVINELATHEDTLCQPRQRTMDEIRKQLGIIDQGHLLAVEMGAHIEKLEHGIQEVLKKTAMADRSGPLTAERKNLVKEQSDLIKELAHVTPDKLIPLQNSLAALTKKIAEIDAELSEPKDSSSKGTIKKGSKRNKKTFLLPDIEDSEDEKSGEEDDRAVMVAWNEMDSEEKKEYTAKVRKSIQKYLLTGKLKDFKAGHRRALRTIQCLLPEESFTSRDVATAIFTTTHSNLKCRYHSASQKVRVFDRTGDFLVQGVGYPAKYSKKGSPVTPAPGYMNCGCLIDDALLDLFFWKTLSITSTRRDLPLITESMKGDTFRPRIRAFVIKLFKTFSLLTVDDIFNSERPFGKPQRELHLYKLSVGRIANYILECAPSLNAAALVSFTGEENREENEEETEVGDIDNSMDDIM